MNRLFAFVAALTLSMIAISSSTLAHTTASGTDAVPADQFAKGAVGVELPKSRLSKNRSVWGF